MGYEEGEIPLELGGFDDFDIDDAEMYEVFEDPMVEQLEDSSEILEQLFSDIHERFWLKFRDDDPLEE
ncbi:hypothetical protein CTI12_AA188740 [Artemisia annua]|uniref:Uncharacterized protein n=1 Tax=Artemisia annua TaxID=35608 RepID=A0A2U1P6L8_ARTAN|nr:hypothetical protein CTI12_AA188740 [Artemisia annua]